MSITAPDAVSQRQTSVRTQTSASVITEMVRRRTRRRRWIERGELNQNVHIFEASPVPQSLGLVQSVAIYANETRKNVRSDGGSGRGGGYSGGIGGVNRRAVNVAKNQLTFSLPKAWN